MQKMTFFFFYQRSRYSVHTIPEFLSLAPWPTSGPYVHTSEVPTPGPGRQRHPRSVHGPMAMVHSRQWRKQCGWPGDAAQTVICWFSLKKGLWCEAQISGNIRKA